MKLMQQQLLVAIHSLQNSQILALLAVAVIMIQLVQQLQNAQVLHRLAQLHHQICAQIRQVPVGLHAHLPEDFVLHVQQ